RFRRAANPGVPRRRRLAARLARPRAQPGCGARWRDRHRPGQRGSRVRAPVGPALRSRSRFADRRGSYRWAVPQATYPAAREGDPVKTVPGSASMLCIYAVCSRLRMRMDLTGVEGEPLHLIAAAGLAAVVGEVTRVPHASIAAFRRHDAVV